MDVRYNTDMDHFITYYGIECPPGAESAVLEDSIMQKGRPVTAGSKILENFISPLDATVVTRLEASGIKILGKTKMDEFGAAGLFAEAKEESSGAVSAVADGDATFALCNDYSGTVRRQAAARGVCYIHPTYGTVSRYGLIPAAPSMDHIGVVCKTPADGFRVLSIIAGYDPKDGAMLPAGQGLGLEGLGFRGQGLGDEGDEGREGVRIGVPVNVLGQIPDTTAVEEFAKGFETVDFELKYFDVYAQVMQILCCAEISSSTTRYDGVKFGYRASGFKDLHELYIKSRTEAFGPEAKFTAIAGAMLLSQEKYDKHYDKAMRIRRLIKESLEFDKYDAIILPASGGESGFRLALHALPQLCGLPSLTMPFNGSGITLVADAGGEGVLVASG